jgi:WS/DGAT/MGAT family acyltransferase
MSKRIPPLDLMFLLTETPNSPKHVGALMRFELPVGRGRETIDKIVKVYRGAQPTPPFNYVPELFGVGLPSWKVAREIDARYHLQHLALPPGATDEDLYRLVESLHEPVLDRNRPLYRVWMIEGIDGGRSLAVYLKIHHAIIDGASAVMRMGASLTASPTAPPNAPFYALQMSDQKPQAPKRLLEQLGGINDAARRQTIALKDLSIDILKKSLGRLRLRPREGSQPFTAPHTPMNEPARAARSFAAMELSVSEMKLVSKAFDGTINDVSATIVDAGLHRYLQQIGQPSKQPLVVMCPVSLRAAGDTEATTKVSAIFVPLGAPGASIGDRMERVMVALNSAKDNVRAFSNDAAMMYSISAFGLGEAADVSRLGRYTGHIANFVLSNVPGAREELYLAGAHLKGIYPVSALGAGIGLNVTLVSSGDRLGFGFVGSGASLPHLTDLARHTAEAFDELKAVAAHRSSRAVKSTAAKKSSHSDEPRRTAKRATKRVTKSKKA